MDKVKEKSRTNLQDGWAQYLDMQPWSLWTTLSTGYELTIPAARRSMIRMYDQCSKIFPCSLFWAAEKFDVKEGYHIHSLWGFDGNVQQRDKYQQFVDNWRLVTQTDKTQSSVYSERYDKSRGAHYYCSKYITKKITDYDYFHYSMTNREKLNNGVKPGSHTRMIKGIVAKKKIERLCKRHDVDYIDLMNDYKQEEQSNRSWLLDIKKEEKKIYGYRNRY